MSLDARTMEWLARRNEGLKPECWRCDYLKREKPDCTYVPPYLGEWCYLDSENQDWADVAEFSERVAQAAARGERFLRPEGCSWREGDVRKTNCPPGYDVYRCAGMSFCNLYRARHIVEEEMEKENRRVLQS